MPVDTQMTAVVLEAFSKPLTPTKIKRPTPGPGEVLLRIVASGVNPLDVKIWQGLAAHARHPPPAILGMDASGVIDGLGAGVSAFRPGDEVYGMIGGVGGRPGSLAAFAAVDVDLLAPKPRNLGFREAAALPLTLITAWEGLVDRAGVREGQTLLVIGGTGGVGHIVIQLARARGAQVFATASAGRRDDIERLGATFIDRSEPVAAYVDRHTAGRGFAAIYDTVGALDDAFHAVGRFGHVVSALGWGAHSLAPLSFQAGSYSGIFTLLPLLTGEGRRHHGEILRAATRLVEAGKLVPIVDPRRYTLDMVGQAHAAASDGSARAKLVVDVDPDLIAGSG